MAEDIFLPGKLTDLKDPAQLALLNRLLEEMLERLNQIDPGGVALAWIEGAAAGKVIASAGVGNSPVWEAEPTLTTATLSGLTASQLVSTDAGKTLISTDPATFATAGHNHDATYAPIAKGVTNGDTHDHNGGDGAQIAYGTLSGTPTLGTIASQNANSVTITGGAISGTGITLKAGTYTDGDTTPSVSGINYLSIRNTNPTTITNLDDGVEGQLVVLHFQDSNTTVNRNNAFLSGGVSFVSTAEDTLTLLRGASAWTEVARGVNS